MKKRLLLFVLLFLATLSGCGGQAALLDEQRNAAVTSTLAVA